MLFLCVVTVSLKPAGNAPMLSKKKFLVERNRTVGWIHQWLKKHLKCEPDESIVSNYHVYQNPMSICANVHVHRLALARTNVRLMHIIILISPSMTVCLCRSVICPFSRRDFGLTI